VGDAGASGALRFQGCAAELMYELVDYLIWLQRYRVRHYVANSI
jgi:hypothetical protein